MGKENVAMGRQADFWGKAYRNCGQDCAGCLWGISAGFDIWERREFPGGAGWPECRPAPEGNAGIDHRIPAPFALRCGYGCVAQGVGFRNLELPERGLNLTESRQPCGSMSRVWRRGMAPRRWKTHALLWTGRRLRHRYVPEWKTALICRQTKLILLMRWSGAVLQTVCISSFVTAWGKAGRIGTESCGLSRFPYKPGGAFIYGRGNGFIRALCGRAFIVETSGKTHTQAYPGS